MKKRIEEIFNKFQQSIHPNSEWNDADYAPELNAAEIQGPSPHSTELLIAIVLFFLAAITWANLAVIDEVTHAEGKVVPSSKVQIIQHLEGGILNEILVNEGDVVKKGQILLKIKNTGALSTLGELRSRKASLEAEIARLRAEERQSTLVFPSHLSTKHHEAIKQQRLLFKARQAELNSQDEILRQQADQKKQEKTELTDKLQRLKKSLKFAQEELAITRPLVRQKIVPKIKLLQL